MRFKLPKLFWTAFLINILFLTIGIVTTRKVTYLEYANSCISVKYIDSSGNIHTFTNENGSISIDINEMYEPNITANTIRQSYLLFNITGDYENLNMHILVSINGSIRDIYGNPVQTVLNISGNLTMYLGIEGPLENYSYNNSFRVLYSFSDTIFNVSTTALYNASGSIVLSVFVSRVLVAPMVGYYRISIEVFREFADIKAIYSDINQILEKYNRIFGLVTLVLIFGFYIAAVIDKPMYAIILLFISIVIFIIFAITMAIEIFDWANNNDVVKMIRGIGDFFKSVEIAGFRPLEPLATPFYVIADLIAIIMFIIYYLIAIASYGIIFAIIAVIIVKYVMYMVVQSATK